MGGVLFDLEAGLCFFLRNENFRLPMGCTNPKKPMISPRASSRLTLGTPYAFQLLLTSITQPATKTEKSRPCRGWLHCHLHLPTRAWGKLKRYFLISGKRSRSCDS